MSEPAPENASAPAPVPAPAAKRRPTRRMMLLVAGLLLCTGGGGWFLAGRDPAVAPALQKAEKKAPRKPLFTTLEPFTVNLQDPRGERFAQVGVTLQFDNPEVEVDIKDRLPALRNEILMLISSKAVEDLLSMEGKQQLAQEIRLRSARALGADPAMPDNPIRAVLFSQFIVQ